MLSSLIDIDEINSIVGNCTTKGSNVTLCDAEKTFRKIREKRLKELGIDF